MRRAPCDLRLVAQQATRLIEPLAQQRGQCLTVDLPAEPVSFTVDVACLERGLANLLGNAVKFGRAGGSVQLRPRREAAAVRLTVTDDRLGIPPEMRGRIFERFTRLEPESDRQTAGSGLGLAIARAGRGARRSARR